ncbi:MAG: glycosyltransferase family 2 protein [Ktedonobacteraceae bacterium]|nr:glycosyltransferase family 2 protein [Ktedonobacteraceae bacterium]
MLDTKPTISVVICAYTENRWDDLLAAVESIRLQSLPPSEIILVIDHNPALLERVQAQIPGVISIENTGPQGLSGARNSGVAASQGELIAFLDDDAMADPRWLELMTKCCQDPHVLGAGGIVEPYWPGPSPTWFPKEFYWVIGCSYQDFQNKVTRVRNAYGGNICIRRELFETVGGFRTGLGRSGTKSLPLGCEETELCIRARQRWPDRFFLCDPNAVSQHRIPPQRINGRYFRSRCYAEGLSKAALTSYVGTKDGLAAEQAYTLQLLPRGIMRGIRDGLRGDLAGFMRAWMIIVGLTATAIGYLTGTVSNALQSRASISTNTDSLPTLVGESGEQEASS